MFRQPDYRRLVGAPALRFRRKVVQSRTALVFSLSDSEDSSLGCLSAPYAFVRAFPAWPNQSSMRSTHGGSPVSERTYPFCSQFFTFLRSPLTAHAVSGLGSAKSFLSNSIPTRNLLRKFRWNLTGYSRCFYIYVFLGSVLNCVGRYSICSST